MKYQMLVKNLFNDMYLFFSGTEPIGLQRLAEDYQDEPLLTAFLGNLDQALKISYMDAMQESYAFYKRYCGRTLKNTDLDAAVSEIRSFMENGPMTGAGVLFWHCWNFWSVRQRSMGKTQKNRKQKNSTDRNWKQPHKIMNREHPASGLLKGEGRDD